MPQQFLNGLDVRAYTIQGNGWDLNLGLNGNTYAMLGMYEELELTMTVEDSVNTPSSQYLEQSRMTGFTWEITAKHWVPYADANPPGLDLLFAGNFNLMLIFQLVETGAGNGPYYTAFGRIKTDSVAITRDSVKETLSIKNAGPVGTINGGTPSSLFVNFGTPAQVAITSLQALAGSPAHTTFTPYAL